MKTIAILGTLDTKGEEHSFVAELIHQRGHRTLLIDTGTQGDPTVKPDVSRSELVGNQAFTDRGEAVAAMAEAAAAFCAKLVVERKIDGILSLGGGGGTAISTAAMRALPVGFPKLMVSTLAASESAPVYMGVKDVTMMPSIVDIAGLNRISRPILANAAGAISGMAEIAAPASNDNPMIVASMFGNTTDCVNHAKEILETAGYEVLVFHATGTGGRTMESLIESGLVTGVLDLTTTELADEHVGGILSAGPARLEAAARAGVPTVIAPGCLDMVNFGEPDSVPKQFAKRKFYHHNPQVTLMRTSANECCALGEIMAGKINRSTGPVKVMLPLAGISIISQPGGPFHDGPADEAFFNSMKSNLRNDIPVEEFDCAINDTHFAEAAARALLDLMSLAS